MSVPQAPKRAKLVVGLFTPDKPQIRSVVEALRFLYGDLDLVSGWFPFDYTRYYEKEMGWPLFRRMAAFKKLIEQDQLAEIKLQTNRIENRHRGATGRSVNIDPGYLLLERFVLATGKNYSHRIHIGQGIYADLTLIFRNGRFDPLPWTYPDYREPVMIDFLNKVRLKYASDLRLETAEC